MYTLTWKLVHTKMLFICHVEFISPKARYGDLKSTEIHDCSKERKADPETDALRWRLDVSCRIMFIHSVKFAAPRVIGFSLVKY